MPKSLKRNKQQRAKEAKSCMKAPTRKMTRLEHARQNIFKSLTNSVDKNLHEFVMLNKHETFQKLDRIVLDKIKDLRKQGFYLFFFNFLLIYNLWY